MSRIHIAVEITFLKLLNGKSLLTGVTRWPKHTISMFEILEPGSQYWANTFSMVSQFNRMGIPTFYSKITVFTVCAYNDIEMHY